VNLEPTASAKSPWRNPLLYTGLIVACVALYVVFIFYTRYESARRYEEQNREHRMEQRHEDDVRAVEQLGGSGLAIRGLYLSPSVIALGQSAQLCYDVANAKTVTLDPPVAEVWPSHSRCINVSPKKTTLYKLSITGANGELASQSVELRVK